MPTVDPRWVRGPADRLAIERGCWFDDDAGRFACDFVETFCCQSKGRWAGKPIELLPWQRDFIMRLFSWKTPDGLRRYRRAYLEVAKKNGKSTLVSALVLFLLMGDGEGAPEVYLNACDREQASIVFDEARRMVEASPDLRRRLKVINSGMNRRIIDPEGNGKIVANSADVPSKDGVNASGIVFDELHRQPGRELWDVFEYAAASREQPLKISITTAGEEESGVWHEQRDYSEKVNLGAIPDITHLGVVYRALETDDIDDPATWSKANPSLGATLKESDFARELDEAKRSPEKLQNFKRLRLNIVARGSAKFLDVAAWDACGTPPRPAEQLRGKPAWMGLDLSSISDLAALATLYGDQAAGFDVLMHFWLPEGNVGELELRHGVPYREWADLGLITLTPGNVIDYAFIRRAVNELAAECDLRKLLVDPYNATQLAGELAEQDGLPVELIRQGFLSLSPPTKELERLVLGGKVRHGANPILRWHALNAVAERDAADNVKLSKRKSKLKIDGMAALINGIAAATSGPAEDDGPSVYETRGVLLV